MHCPFFIVVSSSSSSSVLTYMCSESSTPTAHALALNNPASLSLDSSCRFAGVTPTTLGWQPGAESDPTLIPHLCRQLLGDGGQVLALELGDLQLTSRGLAGASGAGNSAGAQGATAADVVHIKQGCASTVAVRHVDHALVGKNGDAAQQCGLLTSNLAGGGGKEAKGLAGQRLLLPVTTSSIPKSLHLSCHGTETGGKPNQERVSLWQVVGVENRVISLGWSMHLLQDFSRQGLSNLVNGCGDTLNLLDTLLSCLSKLPYVAICAVVDDVDLDHFGNWLWNLGSCWWGWRWGFWQSSGHGLRLLRGRSVAGLC
mmetsp:Transcript_1459/g.3217  ORF Transcript_1459/g.3217 Transcript_1459/m.3217 type:complete len:314 (+) Transcript_1459:214-1155(+)